MNKKISDIDKTVVIMDIGNVLFYHTFAVFDIKDMPIVVKMKYPTISFQDFMNILSEVDEYDVDISDVEDMKMDANTLVDFLIQGCKHSPVVLYIVKGLKKVYIVSRANFNYINKLQNKEVENV